MSLAAGKCGNGLHEIKDAFRFAMFFAQNGSDDVQGSDRHRDRPESVSGIAPRRRTICDLMPKGAAIRSAPKPRSSPAS